MDLEIPAFLLLLAPAEKMDRRARDRDAEQDGGAFFVRTEYSLQRRLITKG